jgi:osmoprotectant transport system ATP-binding protein
MAPANDFVEDFVGADRALKRLALLRVADIDLWTAPLARAGEMTADVRGRLAGAEVPHVLLVDERERPRGWLSAADLERERVPERPYTSPEPVLDLDDVMRDALSDLLQAATMYAPVVDGAGRVRGVLSIEIISEFLASDEARSDEHPATQRPEV